MLFYTTYFTHRVPTILTEHKTYFPGCSSLHGYGTQKCIRRSWHVAMFLNKQNASSLRMFTLPALKSNSTHYTSSISTKYFKNCPSSLHNIFRHFAEETSSIKVPYVKFFYGRISNACIAFIIFVLNLERPINSSVKIYFS